ncbi:ankyrin repeat domain-containing protein [Nocardia testacea]|uniref:ankyrin repeat domain-containing protein n=1 Tax=Nocardia testacea TaxID=248551 RepID=UPI003A8B8ED0
MVTPFDATVALECAAAIAAHDSVRLGEALAAGADPNTVGDEGLTLLHWAVLSRSEPACAVLLEAGADPHRTDDEGDTPVHCAAETDGPEYLTTLLTRADPNVANSRTGRTPLLNAVLRQQDRNVAVLLAHRADPNIADLAGELPLHAAAQLDGYADILALLEAGADPTAVNGQGVTFRRYLFMTPSLLLPPASRAAVDRISAWLAERGIPAEEG